MFRPITPKYIAIILRAAEFHKKCGLLNHISLGEINLIFSSYFSAIFKRSCLRRSRMSTAIFCYKPQAMTLIQCNERNTRLPNSIIFNIFYLLKIYNVRVRIDILVPHRSAKTII